MNPNAELLEIALPLRPQRPGPAPPGLGATGHGVFFDLLARADPGLADRLHRQPNERRPFTVSPLLERVGGGPAASVHPQRSCWLRITLLDHEWVARWREQLEPALPAATRLHLAPRHFPHVEAGLCPWDYLRDPDGPPPWRREARYADLVQAPPFRRWRVRFVTPTTFQASAAPADRPTARPAFSRLPLPVELLRSLAVQWVKWAPDELKPLAARESVLALAQGVRLEQPRLHQAAGVAGRIGLVGDAVLVYADSPAAVAEDLLKTRERLFSALLRYATFAGAGVQTARGMGIIQVEPVENEA